MWLISTLIVFTSNVAKNTKLYPNKGCLAERSDADILLLDDDLQYLELSKNINWIVQLKKEDTSNMFVLDYPLFVVYNGCLVDTDIRIANDNSLSIW